MGYPAAGATEEYELPISRNAGRPFCSGRIKGGRKYDGLLPYPVDTLAKIQVAMRQAVWSGGHKNHIRLIVGDKGFILIKLRIDLIAHFVNREIGAVKGNGSVNVGVTPASFRGEIQNTLVGQSWIIFICR